MFTNLYTYIYVADAELNTETVMVEFLEEEPCRNVWTDSATKLLLQLVAENIDNVGKTVALKSKAKLWKLISSDLTEAGFGFSTEQV